MANVNRVELIGRMTRDPETRTFANGGKVTNWGFCVNNREKDDAGNWKDKPVWLDCKAFDSSNSGRKLASLAEESLRKGHQVYLFGYLDLDTWDDKTTGQKRQQIKIVVTDIQFLEPPPADRQGRTQDTGHNGDQGDQGQGGQQQRSTAKFRRPTTQAPPADPQGDPNEIPF